jgi:hypothetical protein
MAVGDLHQPPTSPDVAILQRLAALEAAVQQQGVTLGIGGSEGVRLRLIRGIVFTGAGAAALAGSGFTVTPATGTGLSIVNFTVPFTGVPAVVGTPYGATGSNGIVEVAAFGPGVSSVQFSNSRRDTGAAADAFISFVAVGPA